MHPKTVFIDFLKHYMSQLPSVPYSSDFDAHGHVPKLTHSIPELAGASVVAILEGGEYKNSVWKKQKWRWKYSEIEQFIKNNHSFLVKHFPSLSNPLSFHRVTIRNYLATYMSSEDFAKLFVRWTKEVHHHYGQIQPCSLTTAKSGFDTKPRKVLIWAVYRWKEENPLIGEIVKQLVIANG